MIGSSFGVFEYGLLSLSCSLSFTCRGRKGWKSEESERQRRRRRPAYHPRRKKKTIGELWAQYKRSVGCFHCGATKKTLDFAHFKASGTSEEPRVSQMMQYIIKSHRKQYVRKLGRELAKGGLLCRACHVEQKKSPSWVAKYKKEGADHWPDFINEYTSISDGLDDYFFLFLFFFSFFFLFFFLFNFFKKILFYPFLSFSLFFY